VVDVERNSSNRVEQGRNTKEKRKAGLIFFLLVAPPHLACQETAFLGAEFLVWVANYGVFEHSASR